MLTENIAYKLGLVFGEWMVDASWDEVVNHPTYEAVLEAIRQQTKQEWFDEHPLHLAFMRGVDEAQKV